MSQVSLVPILLWVAALAATGIEVWREPRPILRSFIIDRLLRYLFLFPLGVQGVWAFIGHVFFPSNPPPRSAGQRARSNMKWGSPIWGWGSPASMPPSRASRRGWPPGSSPLASCSVPASAISGISPPREISRPAMRADHGHRFSHAHRRYRAAVLRQRPMEAEIAGDARARGRARSRPQGDAQLSAGSEELGKEWTPPSAGRKFPPCRPS